MDYFKKIEDNKAKELDWNIPERKQGTISIIGGHAQNFRTSIKISEFLANNYPLEAINTVLPDALKSKLPPLPNFRFLPSTDSGSFSESEGLKEIFNSVDFSLVIGDLSKNSITKRAITSAQEIAASPLIMTRDTIDLVAEENPEKMLQNENITIFGSLIQLQKLLKSVYYPKMILLSQSLVQISEVLHKFTLSYPVSLITFHANMILIAKNGKVYAIPLNKTDYSPITLWGGELAAKIAVYNLYNPQNFLEATTAAIFS